MMKLRKIGAMSTGLCNPRFAASAHAPVKSPKKTAPARGWGFRRAQMAPLTPEISESATASRAP